MGRATEGEGQPLSEAEGASLRGKAPHQDETLHLEIGSPKDREMRKKRRKGALHEAPKNRGGESPEQWTRGRDAQYVHGQVVRRVEVAKRRGVYPLQRRATRTGAIPAV